MTADTREEDRDRLRKNGYPPDSIWASQGFYFTREDGNGVLGHRDIKLTVVLSPRLLRDLARKAARLADRLDGGEEQAGDR